MKEARILLVEDDESLGFVTKDNLESAGYQVNWSRHGREGMEAFSHGKYDLCILDVMLPKLDGFSLAKHIRKEDEFVPILFLTARSMEEDRLRGFEIGGDDYITKPFSIRELLYRVEVFIRRSDSIQGFNAQPQGRLLIGEYEFNPRDLELRIADEAITLTKMEADLLSMLVENKNALVQRSDILVRIWGEDDYFKGRSLDVFISRLRKYLQKDERIRIQNHHGVGFSLVC